MVHLTITEPLHSCKYCGLEYRKTPPYIKHLLEFHNADLPECSFCHKQFLLNKDLHEHLEDIHTADGGNKRHICSNCSCSFKWLKDLKKHQAHKHGPHTKPILQCKYCRCDFYQRSTYTNHMVDKHWTNNVFQCNECLHKFRFKYLLVRHIQIKHDMINQWPKCKFCPASYKWARDLEKHYQQKHRTLWLKIAQNDKSETFKCGFNACLQRFESKENFLEHYLNEHKDDLPNEIDIQCRDILTTKQISNQNESDKSYNLIFVPERFSEEIVDFELELRKINDFKELIDKRISDSTIEQYVYRDGHDTASSITDAESETDLQNVSLVKNLYHNISNNLLTEKEQQCLRRNDLVTENESNIDIQKDNSNTILKDLRIIVTRLEDDVTLYKENREVQSTNDTSKLNIHDLNAPHIIRNNLLIDINVEKKIAKFFLCHVCKLKFRVRKSLEHHMSEEHNVISSHKCKFCEAEFPFKYYLRQHIRGEHRHFLQRCRPSKTIETCAKCKLTFESKQLYKIHMKIEHLQSSALKCGSCNITFNTRGMLNKHRRLKHNPKKRIKNDFNEQSRHDNVPIYKCIACGVVCKNTLCLEEHMQMVHKSEENRQNVENDLVEINKKVEEMELERKRISRSVKNVKITKEIRKNVRPKKFVMKIRPFGRNLIDVNSRFVLKNGVITSSELEEDDLDGIAELEKIVQAASNKEIFGNGTNSSLCNQKSNLRKTRMQEPAVIGRDVIINTPKQNIGPRTNRSPKRKSCKKELQNFENNISGAKRIILIEEGSNQSSMERRKSVRRQAMNSPETGEVKKDDDGKNMSTRLNPILKKCKESQQFSENITFSSNNSNFVGSVHLKQKNLSTNSKENQANIKVITDLITAKTIPKMLSYSDEVLEIGGMVSITDETALKSNNRISKAYIKHNAETSIKNYMCHLCNCVFENKNLLETHVGCHKIIYRCPMCHLTFKRKGDLTRHVKSKHDVPVYTSTPNEVLKNIYADHSYCVKLFNKKLLAENIPPNTDLLEKQFKCNFCDKYFAITDKLQQHVKQFHKMTNVRLCTCVTCNAVFFSYDDLHDHLKFVHSADDVCMKDVSESSQDRVEIPLKRFNWKKSLVQTYKNENISDNDKE